MQVRWNGLDRDAWDSLHRTAAAPLQQDWAYGEAMRASGVQCLRAQVLADTGEPLAQAQFIARRVAWLVWNALCTRGPVFAETIRSQAPAKAQVYRALQREVPLRRPRVLLFSPDEPAGPAAGLDRLHRVITGQSTVLIDLDADTATRRAALHPKWRNRLVAAERAGLRVQRVGARPAQYRWLIERETAQRASRGYQALPPGFVEAYQAARPPGDDPVLTLRVDIGREPVAAMMFLIHGTAATYHLGWSGEQGRESGAHNLLLWQAMDQLAQRGIRLLDLGGVNTASGAGIARFKLGSGGRVVTLAGTFL
ncbi:MAG: GNAT family N-acetyltransferase [Burkholderiales bacterium]|nr:GNAT family N-acetyltransferase [Burkholderiales bacterium]